MINSFENFTFTILKLNKLIQKIKLVEMEEYGLRAVHVMCIYYLYVSPEGLTSSELVRHTLEDKAAISRSLGTLRERGYVTFDSRKYNSKVQLTAEGGMIAQHIVERAECVVNVTREGLSEEERESFIHALGTITKRLESYYNELLQQKGKESDTEE